MLLPDSCVIVCSPTFASAFCFRHSASIWLIFHACCFSQTAFDVYEPRMFHDCDSFESDFPPWTPASAVRYERDEDVASHHSTQAHSADAIQTDDTRNRTTTTGTFRASCSICMLSSSFGNASRPRPLLLADTSRVYRKSLACRGAGSSSKIRTTRISDRRPEAVWNFLV